MTDKSFLDDLDLVMAKFESCEIYATEVILDSTTIDKMRSASLMSDSTTLEDVIGEEGYQKTNQWFYQLTQLDLAIFKRYCPAAIQMLLLSAVHRNVFPHQSEPLEPYFQSKAKNKKIIGLETIEQQVNMLYRTYSYKTQGEKLLNFISHKETLADSLVRTDAFYKSQHISELYGMMKSDPFVTAEDLSLLFERNLLWMQKLLSLFRMQSTFVCVGVLHLAGDDGLIQLLRQHGYTATPIALK
jgi:uncharacterized protein YbaP (TraB family)